jgi:Ca-activated chloride channel family protein
MMFLYPYLLLLIPLFLAGLYLKHRFYAKPSLNFSFFDFLNTKKTYKHYLRIGAYVLIVVGFILCIIALARPQSVSKFETFKSSGIDIMLVFDTSGSMEAIDPVSKISRMEYAKQVAKDFVLKRQNDRIGIVVFSSVAFTQAPLTMDKNALARFIDLINTKITRADGTAIGTAIATAVNRLSKTPSKSQIIILLTDGINNSGEIDPVSAAKLAADLHIKIYAVGIGGSDDYMNITGPDGITRRAKSEDINFNDTPLKEISALTGGEYFWARNAKDLTAAFKTIDTLEKSEIDYTRTVNHNEEYLKFLIWAFWLIFSGSVISAYLKRF